MSMHHLRGARALLAGAATAALLLGGALGASADPIDPETGLTDLARPVDGVGSDTTQDLNNGLAAVVTNNDALILGSWDATGSATIQTRTGGATFARPNGSGSGVNALKAAKTGGQWQGVTLNSQDISFARSSSAATFVPGGDYSYIPLAVDAVTYASAPGATVPDELTRADLTAIYSASNGQSVTLSNNVAYTVGREGTGAQIVPFLPQTGSGTRSFFVGQLGLTEATLGSAVAWSYSGGSVQEHDGAPLAAVPNSIAPFSIAQYIAQGNATALSTRYGVTVLDRRDGAVLHTMKNNSGVVTQPIVDGALNTAFPIARPVFTVVRHSDIADNANLEHAFVGDDGAVYSATSSAGSFTIEDFGFGSFIDRDSGINGVLINGENYRAGDAESYRTN
ncbi:hypothetical protein ACFS27_26170 [Promicromonospora vindobonensis]|uniref:Uncharacterized protein n=1 Tax=Promicromonospora vindobonensis TaxID=195748 RepID=A0ABW5W0I6_9MICO